MVGLNEIMRAFLQKSVVSEQFVSKVCSGLFSLVGALTLISGILRVEKTDLAEEALYSALSDTLLLTAVFIGFALDFHRSAKARA